MPIIDVSLLEGRSQKTKAALMRELTDVAERVLGVPRESVRVLLREVAPEHWAIGGVPRSEVRRSDVRPRRAGDRDRTRR